MEDEYENEFHFSEDSLFDGLKFYEFCHLDEKDKKKLVKLMSRISEKSYRRGVQQAIVMLESDSLDQKILDNLYEYRYENPLSMSPGLDKYKTTSAERFDSEYNMIEIGLPSAVDDGR